MRLGIPLIAFSLCMFAGYAEVRSQSKSGPNGFALVDKAETLASQRTFAIPTSPWAPIRFSTPREIRCT